MVISILLLLLIGLVAGILAGLLGIGGGLVIVPAVTVLLTARQVDENLAVPVAVATSLATMLLTAASAVWFHYRRGAIDRPTVARLGSGVAAGAACGAWLAASIPSTRESPLFILRPTVW